MNFSNSSFVILLVENEANLPSVKIDSEIERDAALRILSIPLARMSLDMAAVINCLSKIFTKH